MPDSLSLAPRRLARLRCRGLGVPLALGLITFLAFLPALWNDFVAWDDRRNLYENPDYRGLGWTQLKWMFTTSLLGHYIPLTWLSFGLDFVVWGMNPVGYHLTNLVLHVVATVLFYFVARRVLREGIDVSPTALAAGAAAAALFFGIHPLRVESVAWATERRDVLSGALFLLTILLYLHAARASGPRRRWLLSVSVASYLLALASKAIVITLPVVLVVLDVYPLARLRGGPRDWGSPSRGAVWVEKVPYLLLGAVGAVVSYSAQARVLPDVSSSWLARTAHVFYGFWFHLLKTAVPVGLSPLYEAPARIDPWEPRFLASAIGVVGAGVLTLLLHWRWRRSRGSAAALALWAYYVVMLAPVSGIIPMGSQLTADRYSYLACLGWAMLVGAGGGLFWQAATRGTIRPRLVRLTAAGAVIGLVGLGTVTWRQVQVWHDTERLWRHAVGVTPECGLCHKFLGDTLIERGALLSGLEHLQRAVTLRPDRVDFRANVGVAFARLGMWTEAVEQYRRVLEREPQKVDVQTNLAVALLRMGRPEEAVERLQEVLRTAPSYPAARVALGFALNDLGKPDEAAGHLRRAIELEPGSAMARLGLVQAYLALGRKDLAREQYEALRLLEPELAASVGSRFAPE